MSANEIFTNATFNIAAGMGTVVMVALSIVGASTIIYNWDKKEER